jgi:hypothetical protein
MNDFARSVVTALSLIGEVHTELLGVVALSLRVSARQLQECIFELPRSRNQNG